MRREGGVSQRKWVRSACQQVPPMLTWEDCYAVLSLELLLRLGHLSRWTTKIEPGFVEISKAGALPSPCSASTLVLQLAKEHGSEADLQEAGYWWIYMGLYALHVIILCLSYIVRPCEKNTAFALPWPQFLGFPTYQPNCRELKSRVKGRSLRSHRDAQMCSSWGLCGTLTKDIDRR